MPVRGLWNLALPFFFDNPSFAILYLSIIKKRKTWCFIIELILHTQLVASITIKLGHVTVPKRRNIKILYNLVYEPSFYEQLHFLISLLIKKF